MRFSIFQKRIPTLFAIVLIIAGIAATSFLAQRGIIFQGGATPSEEPQDVRITNISDSSFTVSYTTSKKIPGIVAYGTTNTSEKTALDDRDSGRGAVQSYQAHHITMKNLKPSTSYVFSITSGTQTYTNNGELYKVVTGPELTESPSSSKPVVGKIVLPDGKIPEETLVYLTADNSQTISTLIKPDGSYILPLNSLRTKNLTAYISLSKKSTLTMFATNSKEQSTITTGTDVIDPVATITLSKNFDFSSSQEPLNDAASQSISSQFPSIAVDTTTATEPSITTPQKDQTFSDAQPQFQGTAAPNTSVTIVIHSDDNIKAKVTADSRGNWKFRPTQKISPGKHTITITARNLAGTVKTIVQQFTIFAAGFSVDQSATPSATPIITQRKRPSPVIPSPTSLGVPSPSIAPVESPTPILLSPVLPSPTLIPSLTTIPLTTLTPISTGIVVQITPIANLTPLPPTGSSTVATLGIGAMILTVIGIFLFLFTRGSTSL